MDRAAPSGFSIRLVSTAPVAPGGTRRWTFAAFARPLVEVEDERMLSSAFFMAVSTTSSGVDGDKGVLGGQRTGVRLHLHGLQSVVEIVTVADGHRLLPVAGVRIEAIEEVMVAAVCIRIRPDGRAEQRQPQQIPDAVVSKFRLVDQAEAVLRVARDRPSAARRTSNCALSQLLFRVVGRWMVP